MSVFGIRAALLFLPVLAMAQSLSTTGVIQGIVTDPSGALLPGVRIIAAREGSGESRAVSTDYTGAFRLTALPIGVYTLRLEKADFGTVEVAPFLVSVGQTVVQRIEMKPAAIVEKIDVREAPDALQTAATSSNVALGYDRIEEAPAQNRNYLSFVFTAPGVAPSNGTNTRRSATATLNPANDSGMIFGGLRGRNNSMLIDGVDNRDETTGGNRVAIGLEMVQEFRVSGTEFAAEFGGAAGGIMNVVTRSGTNTWHGDATLFVQNERLSARNPESLAARKPRFRRYQPGASIYGPIKRDKAFFAAAVEQEWESSEEWSDAPEEALDAINQALRQSKFSRAGVRSVERGLFPADSAGTQIFFKSNYQLGAAHNISGRYAFSRGRATGDVQGADNFGDRSSRGGSLTKDHSFVAGWAAVPAADRVNDLRVQVSERSLDLTPNAGGAMLEIPGVLTLGQSWRLDASRAERHYEAVESFSLARGAHQFGFGGSLHLVKLDARLADRFHGIFLFSTLGDFSSGRPDVFLQAFGGGKSSFNTVPVAFWAQDRWQAASGLTVELGVRYDRQWLPPPLPSPNRNVAPRIGAAWKPWRGSPLVFRAGFGLFYDRYPLAFLNHALVRDGSRGFEQYVAGPRAAEAFNIALGGSLETPLPGAARISYRPSSRFPATYSRKFVIGAERGFGKDTTLTAEYSFILGFHLPRIRNAALGLPPAYELEQTARSSFRGGSVVLNRRLSRELAFLASYSFGRTWDDSSDFDEHPMDPSDIRRDWALSRQHQAHRVAASALFELMEGITAAPIVTAGTGRPVNALDSTDALRTGAYPLSARPFGLARNPYFSPGNFSCDLRLMKTIRMMKERTWFQFGIQFFNLTNHSNPLRISPYFAAGGKRLDSYRGVIETNNARQVEFFAQFEY